MNPSVTIEPAESLRSALSRVGRYMDSDRLPNGELAALKRMNPAAPGVAALAVYRALQQAGIDVEPGTREFESWVLIVHCLALVDGRHDPKISLGRAMAEMRIGEARLRQLLEADRGVLFGLMPRIARRFAAAGASADWTELARLILAIGTHAARAQEAKLRIARSYIAAELRDDSK